MWDASARASPMSMVHVIERTKSSMSKFNAREEVNKNITCYKRKESNMAFSCESGEGSKAALSERFEALC